MSVIPPSILRNAVSIANSVTKNLGFQGEITFKRMLTVDGYGTKGFGSETLLVLIDLRQQQVRTGTGVTVSCRASITFLDIPKLLSVTANQGVNDEDVIILPDGTTGPILGYGGFIDAGTTKPVATEVYLG